MNLVFKGDLSNIPELQKKGLNLFELYVRHSREFTEKVSNIVAIHLPKALDDGRTLNLADQGERGKLSEEFLKKAVAFCRQNAIKKIIFHPPCVSLEEKRKSIQIMVQRLERVYDPAVVFCMENVGLWINRAHQKEPLFAEPDDFIQILTEAKFPLKMTFDVEHFLLTGIMKLFYEQYREELQDLNKGKKTFAEVKNKFERELLEYSQQNNLSEYCHSYLQNTLDRLKPHIEHFHVCGSDFEKYFFNEKSPLLIGEHLAVNFKGNSFGEKTEDRVDHSLWIKKLTDQDLDVVIEISSREGYSLINLLMESKRYLEELQKIIKINSELILKSRK